KALALDDEDYVAHLALGYLYWLRKEPDKAIATYERAITINPNGAEAYAHLGNIFNAIGEPEEGIKLVEKAMRLNPIPPARYLNYLASAYGILGRYEDAIEVYKVLLKRSPKDLFGHIGLTATYMASGHEEEARHQAEELLRLDPAFSVDRWAETIYIKDKDRSERFIDNLRKAGLK
ncbi:MAG: tetratricopeptide repeat protein, partial [Planctomycetota bacterium]